VGLYPRQIQGSGLRRLKGKADVVSFKEAGEPSNWLSVRVRYGGVVHGVPRLAVPSGGDGSRLSSGRRSSAGHNYRLHLSRPRVNQRVRSSEIVEGSACHVFGACNQRRPVDTFEGSPEESSRAPPHPGSAQDPSRSAVRGCRQRPPIAEAVEERG
jgi:hypothetical protein